MTDFSPTNLRSSELVSREESRLLIVDVQQKLVPHIHQRERMIFNCSRLIRGAKVLGVPVSATEQYPAGLGATVEPLAELLGDIPEKIRFSCTETLEWVAAAEAEDDRDKIIVAGIETHVCVQQTVLDLLALGYRPYVPADAVASRQELDWQIALDRMALSGAVITTTEALLFELCETAAVAEFKAISELVKEEENSG
jgi:nicotinamidase-related amidase